MKRPTKKIVYSTSVMLVVFFISFLVKTNYPSSFNLKNTLPSYGVQSINTQDVPDREEKEPVYMSIFKLIVNCNPFKQKKAQSQ